MDDEYLDDVAGEDMIPLEELDLMPIDESINRENEEAEEADNG